MGARGRPIRGVCVKKKFVSKRLKKHGKHVKQYVMLQPAKILELLIEGRTFDHMIRRYGGVPRDADTLQELTQDDLIAWAIGPRLSGEEQRYGRDIMRERYRELLAAYWRPAKSGDKDAAAIVLKVIADWKKMDGIDAAEKREISVKASYEDYLAALE